VLVHVAINTKGHHLVRANNKVMDGLVKKDRAIFNEGLREMGDVLDNMIAIF
jgi:hypothetical protein